ncbi:MAG: diguanylate cyclase [Rhodoferax sp.]|uniref:diguanylate cyclase n=1 Tax=Rhodoferax sp. TaxID=50421 RepID=UPI00181FEFEB|nr:diguanylate cyclase [Rhodoferax sp.]NMM14843.1 diguanylate cyclase [Rhodoferax sp.]NMM19007.1 diguanylate cyclase [Rhodoferax sp.]
MTQIDIGSPRENHLLARLSDNALKRLLPDLEPIKLTLGKVLHEPGQKQVFAYFPTNSIVALIYHTAHGESAKVAMTGCDGMVGIVQILGSDASNMLAMVQTSGGAWRIRTEALRHEFFRGSGLMTQCLRYAQLLMAHMAQLVVCSRHHRLEQQLCRWLLFTIDRLPSNRINTTHELVATLLGVRRQGVSEATVRLETDGIIARQRGRITVIDRAQLAQRTCECYHIVKQEQDRLFTRLLPEQSADDRVSHAQQQYGDRHRRSDQTELALTGSELGWWDLNPFTEHNEILCNERCYGMLGYSQGEIKFTMTNWDNRVHPDDALARATAKQAHFDKVTAMYESEYRIRHKNGHWIWIASRGKVVQRDGAGRPMRMVGTTMDISARKKTELALKTLANTDFLTGVATRRHFVEIAEREFLRAVRYKSPLSLLALDLDHFKRINDNHGHAGGDSVLQSFVQTVGEFLRAADVFGRMGGEEFCVLLPQTDLEGAGALARRILGGVRLTPAPMTPQSVSFTVSLGISSLNTNASSFEELMRAADDALYRAKSLGRDRMELALPND